MKEKDYILANSSEIVENLYSALENIQDRGIGNVEETLESCSSPNKSPTPKKGSPKY